MSIYRQQAFDLFSVDLNEGLRDISHYQNFSYGNLRNDIVCSHYHRDYNLHVGNDFKVDFMTNLIYARLFKIAEYSCGNSTIGVIEMTPGPTFART